MIVRDQWWTINFNGSIYSRRPIDWALNVLFCTYVFPFCCNFPIPFSGTHVCSTYVRCFYHRFSLFMLQLRWSYLDTYKMILGVLLKDKCTREELCSMSMLLSLCH